MIMADNPHCPSHDECMKELRTESKTIDKTVTEMKGVVDGYIQATREYIDASRRDIYGQNGIMERVGKATNQILLQWGLLATIIIALVVDLFKR